MDTYAHIKPNGPEQHVALSWHWMLVRDFSGLIVYLLSHCHQTYYEKISGQLPFLKIKSTCPVNQGVTQWTLRTNHSHLTEGQLWVQSAHSLEFKHVSPVIDWQPVHGVPHPCPLSAGIGSRPPATPNSQAVYLMNEWMVSVADCQIL